MQYEQSGSLPVSKMALAPQYNDESDEAANGDDTTDGDDVVGDVADGYDVNGDEDDDELRNFPPASEMTLAQHRTISHQGRHTFDTFVVWTTKKHIRVKSPCIERFLQNKIWQGKSWS